MFFPMLRLLFLLGYKSVLASLQMHAVVIVTCVYVLILLHMFACVYVLMHVRLCNLFLLICASVCDCLCIDY
jgi:hypothetical protein